LRLSRCPPDLVVPGVDLSVEVVFLTPSSERPFLYTSSIVQPLFMDLVVV
jgi:hypothetical protein